MDHFEKMRELTKDFEKQIKEQQATSLLEWIEEQAFQGHAPTAILKSLVTKLKLTEKGGKL